MDSDQIAHEIEDLETRIERLRALYEQYFMGIERLEPLIPRKEVERRIYVLRREQIRNTGQRFKFQTLVQRYNTFQQYWTRIVREIENGTYRRDVLKVAKRFGEKEAATIAGKRRAEQFARLAEVQEGRKHERDEGAARDGLEGGDGLDGHERLDDADLLADDDDAPTPPPVQRPRPRTFELEDVSEVGALLDERTEDALGIDLDRPLTKPEKKPLFRIGGARVSAKPSEPSAEPGPSAGRAELRGGRAEPHAGRAEPPARLEGRAPEAPSSSPSAVRPPDSGAPSDAPRSGRGGLRWGARPAPSSSPGAAAPPPTNVGAPTIHGAPAGPAAPAPDEGRSRVQALAAGLRREPEPRSARPLDLDLDLGEPAPPPPRAPAAGPDRPQRGLESLSARFDRPSRGLESPSAGLDRPSRGLASPEAGLDRPSRGLASPEAGPDRPSRGLASSSAGLDRPASAPAAPSVGQERRFSATNASDAREVPRESTRESGRDSISDDRLRQLHSQYVESRKKTNESADLAFDRVAQSLKAQAEKLKQQYPSRTIDFEVMVKDGRTVLKPIVRAK